MPMRWDQPGLMAFLQAQGNIEPGEMARTFNCGDRHGAGGAAGLVEAVTAALSEAGETVFRIGEIVAGQRGCEVRGLAGPGAARATGMLRMMLD